ncbi:MAG TPA: HEAT repeat domain-containing protein [Planctomycetaceae bacterium]|nr:HEAT repeat domain-containing protein [Planctomycetaceae bacterium]
MTDHRASRGVLLPTGGQCVVIAAVLCAFVLLWIELHPSPDAAEEQPLPEAIDEPAKNPVESLSAVEAFVRRGTEAIPELVEALKADDAKSRGYAVYGLGRIGPDAADCLDLIRERFADEDAGVRKHAVFAFAFVSRDPDEIGEATAPLLADADEGVREAAAKELIAIGPSATKLVLGMLRHDIAAIRGHVLRILRAPMVQSQSYSEIEQNVRELVNDPDPAIQIEAVTALAEWNMAKPSEIRTLLNSEDPARVHVGLVAARTMGAAAAELLPDILARLDQKEFDNTPEVNNQWTPSRLDPILQVLSSMGTAALSAGPYLIRVFELRHDYSRMSIAKTLFAIGVDAEDIGCLLAPFVLDSNRRFVSDAGEWLVEYCPEAARCQVSLLIPRLRGKKDAVDEAVLQALYALGLEAQEAVPALMPLAAHRDKNISEFAAWTLKRAGLKAIPSDPIPAFVSSLADGKLGFKRRTSFAIALGRLGPAARSAIPMLIKFVNLPERPPQETVADASDETIFRAAAVVALGEIGDRDRRVLDALHVQLAARSPVVRGRALESLARLAPDSQAVFKQLLRCIGDDAEIVRARVALAIARMKLDRREAVAPLTAALGDASSYVRTAAALALGKIGPAAGSALPALRRALTDAANKRPNSQIADESPPARPKSFFRIPELDELSVEQAVRQAISAIDSAPAAKKAK